MTVFGRNMQSCIWERLVHKCVYESDSEDQNPGVSHRDYMASTDTGRGY
jgi:hypothetical protein